MHAYSLSIPEQPTVLPHNITFEASDDAAAIEMVETYYSDMDSDLWREDRLVRRFARTEPSA